MNKKYIIILFLSVFINTAFSLSHNSDIPKNSSDDFVIKYQGDGCNKTFKSVLLSDTEIKKIDSSLCDWVNGCDKDLGYIKFLEYSQERGWYLYAVSTTAYGQSIHRVVTIYKCIEMMDKT